MIHANPQRFPKEVHITMAYRNIILEGDPILRKTSRPVERFDGRLHDLLDDMKETLVRANGVGLAAPQVGILRRVVVVDIGDGPIELVNPRVIEAEGEQEGQEGCLSCPGEWGIVRRPAKISVEAQDRHGNAFTVAGEELLAVALSHEIDHLDGRLYKDIALRMLDPDEMEEE